LLSVGLVPRFHRPQLETATPAAAQIDRMDTPAFRARNSIADISEGKSNMARQK
jgi:hypothetical protein